jgi:3-oxoacyl-[acyl-carrier-protein] synthase III
MYASIKAIEYYLPPGVLTNEELAPLFPGRSAEELAQKTGVVERRMSAPGDCSSDMAVAAARKLFENAGYSPSDFDFVLLCTQTPDYFLPATACLVQASLGIPTSAGALDFNLGCSGYIYGLGLAKALVENGQAHRLLLITADTVGRLANPIDRATRVLFGDAATATVIEASAGSMELGPFLYGTDGRGAENLITHEGAFRYFASQDTNGSNGANGSSGKYNGRPLVHMNGSKIVDFSVATVPPLLQELFHRAGVTMPEIDLFVFHQASNYILEMLRSTLRIPKEKYYISMSHSGNTAASTIPIALRNAYEEGRLAPGNKIVLTGFGVGLSWGATLVRWADLKRTEPLSQNRSESA